MSSKWVVWEEKRENFARWSGRPDEALFLFRDDGAEFVTGAPIDKLDQVRLLVINGQQAAQYPQNLIRGIDAWIAGAKAWIHTGSHVGAPGEGAWDNFGRRASERYWPALSGLEKTARKFFGSLYHKGVFEDIAPMTQKGASTAQVLKALEAAWSAGNEAALSERQFESLQQMFPIYLLLTHPEAPAACQALRAAADDAAKTPELLECSASLLKVLATDATDWPTSAAIDAFLAHFRQLSADLGLRLDAAQTLRLSARGGT